MTTSSLRGDLILDEGDRRFPYRDSRGIWTISVGVNMEVRPALMARFAELRAHGIGRDEDDALLDEAIASAEADLDRDLPWWRNLDDVRQDAMVNLAFNLGEGKLRTWTHTLRDIRAGDFKAAAVDLKNDEPWASQVHDRARRIAYQIETGVRAWSVPKAEIDKVVDAPLAVSGTLGLPADDSVYLFNAGNVDLTPIAPLAAPPATVVAQPVASSQTAAEPEEAPEVPPLLKGVLHRFSHFGMGAGAAFAGVGAYVVKNPLEATFLGVTVLLIVAIAIGFAVWWSHLHRKTVVEALNAPKPAVPVALPSHPFLKL